MACQVGIQAYLLWEKAGRPDGADFANDARKTLQQQLASGMSLQQLEKSLKEPSPQVAYQTCACMHACLPACSLHRQSVVMCRGTLYSLNSQCDDVVPSRAKPTTLRRAPHV